MTPWIFALAGMAGNLGGWSSPRELFHIDPCGLFALRIPNQRQRRKHQRQGWSKYR